jgi:hypothetical protein
MGRDSKGKNQRHDIPSQEGCEMIFGEDGEKRSVVGQTARNEFRSFWRRAQGKAN